MNENELRLGNYYAIAEDNGITYKQVTYLIPSAGDWFSNGDNLTHACKPILLTEDWLLKFGFEQGVNNNTFRHIKSAYAVSFIFDNFEFRSSECGDYITTIKYVHQLQNLYFALTDEELIMNIY